MLVTNLYNESRFQKDLLEKFPETTEEVQYYKGLLHLEMAALRRLADKAIETGDLKRLENIYEFLADIMKNPRNVHPDVENAINVSFVENLEVDFANSKYGQEAERIMPDVIRKMWQEMMQYMKDLSHKAKNIEEQRERGSQK